MPRLDLLVPTKIREFTFYDRCAILLDPDEMAAQRVRISIRIIGSPLVRSRNFKYPYSKEFFGYGQGFWLNAMVEEFPINYSSQYVWDYWNEHATIAHQLTNVFDRLTPFLLGTISFMNFLLPLGGVLTEQLEEARLVLANLTTGLTKEINPLSSPDGLSDNNSLNTFVHPFDLIRFRFMQGTIFAVGISSWNLGDTYGGSTPTEAPGVPPYPTENPNSEQPIATPGANDPQNPYGASPPPSSPRDPRLDPDDFSNAPDPAPPTGTILLQGWEIPLRPDNIQPAGFLIGCPAATLALSFPPFANVIDSIDRGVFPFVVDANGFPSDAAILAAFPGFRFGDNNLVPNESCGYGVPP